MGSERATKARIQMHISIRRGHNQQGGVRACAEEDKLKEVKGRKGFICDTLNNKIILSDQQLACLTKTFKFEFILLSLNQTNMRKLNLNNLKL